MQEKGLPQYNPRWLGMGFGHEKGCLKSAAVREGSEIYIKDMHTHHSALNPQLECVFSPALTSSFRLTSDYLLMVYFNAGIALPAISS